MCRFLDIEKTKTYPYRPQSDEMIERFNRTVAQMLATFVKGNRKTWDEHLPFLMLAYLSTVHESTQCTPIGNTTVSCSLCRMVTYVTRELVSTCSEKPKMSSFPSEERL